MADDNSRQQPNQSEKGRRFRLSRRVTGTGSPSQREPLSREEREMQDLADMGDDADRGTPEQDASLRAGCMSFVRVVMLFFVIMFGSIIVTWFLSK